MPRSEEDCQLLLKPGDERARCGKARFTLGMHELEVEFEGASPDTPVIYDLRDIPFNQTCVLKDPEGRPSYLVCNQWGNVHVRSCVTPSTKHYPALKERKLPTRCRISDDLLNLPKLPSAVFHPNRMIPLVVRMNGDGVRLDFVIQGVSHYRFDVPLKSLSAARWLTPDDGHGQPLPVRLKRSILAALFQHRAVDVEWIG